MRLMMSSANDSGDSTALEKQYLRQNECQCNNNDGSVKQEFQMGELPTLTWQ